MSSQQLTVIKDPFFFKYTEFLNNNSRKLNYREMVATLGQYTHPSIQESLTVQLQKQHTARESSGVCLQEDGDHKNPAP